MQNNLLFRFVMGFFLQKHLSAIVILSILKCIIYIQRKNVPLSFLFLTTSIR